MDKNLPNKLTIARLIAVPFFVLAYIFKLNWVALIIFIAASITDTFDGRIARKYNLVSNFGKIVDPVADKVLVYSAFTLMIPEYVASWMLIIILAREFVIAGMRQMAAATGKIIAADMSGKIKTVCQMVCIPAFLLARALPAVKLFYWVGVVMLWASLIMAIYSGAEYILKNKEVFKG